MKSVDDAAAAYVAVGQMFTVTDEDHGLAAEAAAFADLRAALVAARTARRT